MNSGGTEERGWPEPWYPVASDQLRLVTELEREIGPDHALFGARVVPLARRHDDDDVLFALPDAGNRLAMVHLTWSGKRDLDPRFPWTTFFTNWQDWLERGADVGD